MTTSNPFGSALDGVRVLDLTSVLFGPYTSQILGDYGADVIKIEAPAGDSTRQTGPGYEPGRAAIFLGANRNKRSVVLDLKRPAARQALHALLAGADVLMHNMRPEKMARLGLDPDTLCERYPRLVYAGLYGFGQGGAYEGKPAYDDIIQGLCGIVDTVHRQSGAPGYLPTAAADKTCGLAAAHAILAALFQRERTGVGQRIEVPMFETMASFVLVEHMYGAHLADPPAGQTTDEQPAMGYSRVLAPWRRPFQTQDGHICMMPYTDRHWRSLFRHAGTAEDANDPRFATIGERTRNIDVLYQRVGSIVAGNTTAHWLALFEELEIPAAPINRLEDLERDPHLESVGLFVDIEHNGHHYRFTRNPVRLSRSSVAPRMPPGLGEHTREVLLEAGLSPQQVDALCAEGAALDNVAPDVP